MKKLLSSILIAVFLSQTAVFAATYTDFMEAEVAELATLINQCKAKGINPEYEIETYNILNWYVSEGYMELDESNSISSDILKYNADAMTSMYNEAKANLEGYIAGTKTPVAVGNAYVMQDTYVDEDGIYRDKNGDALFTVGYASTGSTGTWNVSQVEGLGTTNIVEETGPSSLYTKNIADKWVTVNNNCGSLLTYERFQEANGNWAVRVVNNQEKSSNRYFFMYQKISVEPSTTYSYGFNHKGMNANGVLIRVLNGTSTMKQQYASVGEEWQTTSGSITTAAGQTELVLQLLCEDVTTALFLDDFYLKKGTGANLVQNSGFDAGKTSDMNPMYLGNVEDALLKAKANNVGVHLIISPHYFPSGLEVDDPENLYCQDPDHGWFIKFNIDHERSRKLIEDYLRTLGAELKKNPNVSALSSIILTNESEYRVEIFHDFYIERYRDYLKEVYNDDISALNEKWGTSYTDFAKITNMEQYCDRTTNKGHYDVMKFNEKVFIDWHSWMAGILREYLPDIEINAKIMSPVIRDDSAFWRLARGIDVEKFAEFSDIAGNDAYAFSSYSTPVSMDSFMQKMLWYDMLHTLTGQPSYNSEDHIIAEGDATYSERIRKIVYADLWQGALHGRMISSIWNWSKHDFGGVYDSDSTNNYLFQTRPDAVEAVSKAGLDLRRNRLILEKMVADKPEIAIFYSKATQSHYRTNSNTGGPHISQLIDAYKGIVLTGNKAGFVTETAPEKVHNYEVLIVPQAVHTTSEAIAEIQKFAANGGKVILVNNCFTHNEFHVGMAATITGAVTKTASSYADYMQIVADAVENDVSLVDYYDSQPVSTVEWSYIQTNGKLYLNVINYGDEDVSLKAVYNDAALTDGEDLISGNYVSTVINAKSFTPMLIEFSPTSLISKGPIISDISARGKQISWNVTREEQYIGADIYYKDGNKYVLIAKTKDKSYTVEKSGTYLISNAGAEAGQQIQVVNDQIFGITYQVSGSYVTVTATNVLGEATSCTLAMQAYDGSGNVYKVNSVKFNGFDKNESRTATFMIPYNASKVTFAAYDSKDTMNPLSPVKTYVPGSN